MQWICIVLAIISIFATTAFALLIKKLLRRIRRPNGKKGGIISLHTAIAFSTVTVIALTTRDWFITALTVILAYLIARDRIDEKKHYFSQVLFGALLGIGIPYGIYYLSEKQLGIDCSNGSGSSENYTVLDSFREEYDDKPGHAIDNREEADSAPELRLSAEEEAALVELEKE